MRRLYSVMLGACSTEHGGTQVTSRNSMKVESSQSIRKELDTGRDSWGLQPQDSQPQDAQDARETEDPDRLGFGLSFALYASRVGFVCSIL